MYPTNESSKRLCDFLHAILISLNITIKILAKNLLAPILIFFSSIFFYGFIVPDKAIESSTAITGKTNQMAFPSGNTQGSGENQMGLGMLSPKFNEFSTIYFYGFPNLQKSIIEHLPIDSLVFTRNDLGFKISYAPPWFVPATLKMDYDVLFMKIVSVHQDFVEVVGNETNGKTVWVGKSQNELIYWPDFLLSVSSVEQLDPKENTIRVKPLAHAGLVTAKYVFLKPINIKSQWIQVELLDQNFKSQGIGWLKWNDGGKMLIRYSLFS